MTWEETAKRIAKRAERKKTEFHMEFFRELAQFEGIAELPRFKFRPPKAIFNRYTCRRRQIEITPGELTKIKLLLEHGHETARGEFESMIDTLAHEFDHYMRHRAANWVDDIAFPPRTYRLSWQDRPQEKTAVEYAHRITTEFSDAVDGIENRLTPFVERWSK